MYILFLRSFPAPPSVHVYAPYILHECFSVQVPSRHASCDTAVRETYIYSDMHEFISIYAQGVLSSGMDSCLPERAVTLERSTQDVATLHKILIESVRPGVPGRWQPNPVADWCDAWSNLSSCLSADPGRRKGERARE